MSSAPLATAATALLVVACLSPLFTGPARAAGITLTGLVTDTAGNPVEGADVWVNQDRRPRRLITDDQGTFHTGDLGVGRIEVVARKEGLALGGVDATIVGPADIHIVLREPQVTRLQVTDKHGNMLEGARIKTMFLADTFHVSVEDLTPLGFPSYRSDSQGYLSIPDLPKHSYLSMVLEHRNFADFHLVTFPVGKELALPMAQGRTVRGRVLASDRTPLARARVSLFRVGAGGKREFAEVVTDPEGFFAATVVPGNYYIAAKHPAHASPPPIPVEVLPTGEEPSGEVLMLPARFVHGRIQDENGNAQAGIEVAFVIERMIVAQTWSQLDGAFDMLIPPVPGNVRVAPPPGYFTDQIVAVALENAQAATISPVVLKRLPVIRGRVLDTDGAPLPNALISSLNLPKPIRIVTGEAGLFQISLDRVPIEEEVRFRAEHPLRFRANEFSIDIGSKEQHTVTLEIVEPDLAPGDPPRFGNAIDHLIDDPAPRWRCDTWFNSDPIAPADLKGKVVVLTLWGGFPTGEVVPDRIQELIVLHRLLEDVPDVQFLAIHDGGKEPQEIQDLIDQAGIAFPVGRDVPDATTLDSYNVMFLPQTVLIDKKGLLRYHRVDGRILDLIKDLRRQS
jgi:hypothetical protein